jgi:hypothetical protein
MRKLWAAFLRFLDRLFGVKTTETKTDEVAVFKSMLAEEVVEETFVAEEAPVKHDYLVHSVSELKALAKEKGLTGYSKFNKAQLVELLEKTE